jgi:hypothetical protein
MTNEKIFEIKVLRFLVSSLKRKLLKHWSESWLTSRFKVLVVKLKQTLFLNFTLKKILWKKSKKRENFEKIFLMIWSGVHLVITPGHFGAFILPLRPYKTSDQYPFKYNFSGPFKGSLTVYTRGRQTDLKKPDRIDLIGLSRKKNLIGLTWSDWGVSKTWSDQKKSIQFNPIKFNSIRSSSADPWYTLIYTEPFLWKLELLRWLVFFLEGIRLLYFLWGQLLHI